MVEAVKERPSAWIMSSLSRLSAPRYGTAGIANTPVAAVARPVSAPIRGPSHHSAAGATEKRIEVRPSPA
jgi:hypothetical protein